MNIIRFLIFAVFLLFFCNGCSRSSDFAGESGGVTETIGIVVSSKGEPIADVAVQFIPTDYIPQKGETQFVTRTSNSAGEFSCEGIPDGEYNLMYNKGEGAAFRESLAVVSGGFTASVIDTLLPVGSLSGVVRLHEKHNSAKVFILIRGTNRYLTPLDSTGLFTIDSLAEGEYTVTFMADYDDYAKFDTTVLITRSFDDTLDDTIKLEYLGIETPIISATDYDSSLLQATVRWNTVQSDALAGYQLFRKVDHPDSILRSIAYMLVDTFYTDSCNNGSVKEGERYLYQVSCINNEQMSGKPSDAASVTFQSLFMKGDSLQLGNSKESEYASMVCSRSGMLYLVRSCESKLHLINSNNLEYIASYPLPDSGLPTDISVVDDTTLLVATNKGVYEIDTVGIRVWRYSAYHSDNEKYTYQVSSLGLQYFYYTASRGSFETPNAIMRFNCYGGKSDTLLVLPRGEIISIEVDPLSEKLYMLSKQFNKLLLEQVPLDGSLQTDLYSADYSSDVELCINGVGSLSLMCKKRLHTFNTEGFSVENQTFLDDEYQAVVALPTGERVLYSRSGKLVKICKKR